MSKKNKKKQYLGEICYDMFKWSKVQFTMKKVVDSLWGHAPFLFLVRDGYLGRDSTTHTISGDEVYWFADVVTQPRVVARGRSGLKYTIPMLREDLQVSPTTMDGKVGRTMTIQEMMDREEYTHFMFADEEAMSVYSGAKESTSEELGLLAICDQYDEMFLACYTLLTEPEYDKRFGFGVTDVNYGPLHSKLNLIPIYMPIEVSPATGMNKRSDRTFLKTMLEFKTHSDSFDFEKKLSEALKQPEISKIMAFDQDPEDNYMYIELVSIVHAHEFGYKTKSVSKKSSSGSKLESNVLDHCWRSLRQAYDDNQPPEGDTSEEEHEPQQKNIEPPPPLPPRDPLGRSKSLPEEKPSTEPIPILPKRSYSEVRKPHYHQRNTKQRESWKIQTKVSETESTKPDQGHSRIESVADIPSDISGMNVDQLIDCLRLINMPDSCIQALKDNDIDGGRLLQIGKHEMIERLQMSKFVAVKLTAFSKQGWRPTLRSAVLCRVTNIDSIPDDISALSVNEIVQCVRLLNITKCIPQLEERHVDGAKLMDLNSEQLVAEYQVSKLEAVKLDKFKQGWRPKLQ